MPTINDARVRLANDCPLRPKGDYVLYWAQMYRRLHSNHALDYALHLARHTGKPLVIYEGLKLNYPWANARFHAFLLDGMAENAAEAVRVGATYWPFVETTENSGRGLVARLCERAVALVTDDYPQFIVPAQIRAIAAKAKCRVAAIDGNGVVPLSLLGPPTAAAAHLRPKLHKQFAAAWAERANPIPAFEDVAPKKPLKPPFEVWTVPSDLRAFVASLPIDRTVPPLEHSKGGTTAGRAILKEFVASKLTRYAEERSEPDDPKRNSSSGLSAHLHYGHIAIDEVVDVALGKDWSPDLLNLKTRNKDDFFCRDANVNGFLDEAITWRDVGFQWHFARMQQVDAAGVKSWQDGESPSFNFATFDFSPLDEVGTLQRVLPPWAMASLAKHATDERKHLYSRDQFERGGTHDKLWNAAQKELVVTGRIHNYLRMLWGKKVLEWSESPESAYRTLEYLNNKYAIDGRDPNSYTGILWCFGLFDRPWPPEREVFGNVRFMSSDNTAKKFDLDGYYDYIRRLEYLR